MKPTSEDKIECCHFTMYTHGCGATWAAEGWYDWPATQEHREHVLACVAAALIAGAGLLFGKHPIDSANIRLERTTYHGEAAGRIRERLARYRKGDAEGLVWIQTEEGRGKQHGG